jgi:alpha-mannosidase
MDRYPEYTFVCSQAQQFDWLLKLYPKLFERIKEKIKKGQFIPIGGTWVEMDCNVRLFYLSILAFN